MKEPLEAVVVEVQVFDLQTQEDLEVHLVAVAHKLKLASNVTLKEVQEQRQKLCTTMVEPVSWKHLLKPVTAMETA